MKIIPLFVIATLTLASLPARAGSFLFGNNTTGAPVFNRPTEPGDALSEIGSAVPYFAQTFTVDATGGYNFSATANDPFSFDTFIHLYAGSFNPGSPLDNIVVGNDDAVNGSPELGSALSGQSLIAGNTYVFVVDGFGNSDFGGFSATISGPGNISAVPEPGTLGLVSLGLAGFSLLRRQKLLPVRR